MSKRDICRRFNYIDSPEIRKKYDIKSKADSFGWWSRILKKDLVKMEQAIENEILDEEPLKKALEEEVWAIDAALELLRDKIDFTMSRKPTLEQLEELVIMRELDVDIDEGRRIMR